jgi:hypothetical protein
MFTKLMGRLALWLEDLYVRLRSKYDLCCYPGCDRQAEYYCITGGHRHCPEHESGFYSDVEFCQSCYESMTPEEIQKEAKECSEEPS